MKYDTVIFDLDGTILDTIEDLKNSLNFAMRELGYPERNLDEVRRFVGNGIRKLIERALPSDADEGAADRAHAVFTAHYTEHCADNTKPYSGIEELIAALREVGCKTAVVSNKADYAVKSLCETYFKGLFDCVAGEKEGVRKKPAPDAVNLAAAKLGAKNAVYIGDSEVDIKTAENAGIDAIIVDWGFRGREFLMENGAKTIVKTPKEILQIITATD